MVSSAFSEEDIKLRYITPAVVGRGWKEEQIRMEYTFTDGRVISEGRVHTRQKPLRADYVLFERNNYPIAVIEAKTARHSVGAGIQQAMQYAEMLGLKFAYSSNGEGFVEYDFITGRERNLTLGEFPTLAELQQRLQPTRTYTPQGEKLVSVPYYTDALSHEPRYYQRIAINNAIDAIASGHERVLIVMATGTGKTYTAFQIIHRLHRSGMKKKILYLADRNILIDQTMAQDFKPFRKVMTKVQGSTLDPSYEIYMALYQQLVSTDDSKPDPFMQVKPDFFDLIVVDECHRGSAKDDSQWRKVLSYFSSATQIGMTATPKVSNEANNIEYFGEPVFTYSLLQGIKDGFLAPYRVTKAILDIDEDGYTPKHGEVDVNGLPLGEDTYVREDIGRYITIHSRQATVAKRITKMLHEIGRMTKTIVFCPDIKEAEIMRQLLVNLNADMMQRDSRYVMRITGDDDMGKKQLDYFIDADEPYPTVVTTSELLATGVDCKTCGLIVIDKEINSMTEFKQIIGRGTRLRTDKGKWHLEILDFRNATRKFHDPGFDGDPLPPLPPKSGGGGNGGQIKQVNPPEPRQKLIIGGNPVEVRGEIVMVLDRDGKTTRTTSLIDFTRQQVTGRYAELKDFIRRWSEAERKEAIVDELKEWSVLIEAVRSKNPAFENADIFDIICHVAYDQKPLTRRERAQGVKKRNYFAKYEGAAREVLEALLDKYAEYGILDIENADILDTAPFTNIGKPQRIVKLFGGIEQYKAAFRELENEIYSVTA